MFVTKTLTLEFTLRGGNMMESQSEHIVSNKPGLAQRLQHKCLREAVCGVLVSLTNSYQYFISISSLVSVSQSLM